MGTRSLTGGNAMSNKTHFMYAISLGLALTPICFSTVSAQERCKVSEDGTAAKSKYTQQHVLDVGDMPGHQIRVFELHRTYPDDKPNCENLKRTESWSRGYSDYVDRNGRAWGYAVISHENGDKIFAEFSGTSQTTVAADGAKKSTFTGVTRYIGGTGTYQGVQGLLKSSVAFDLDKNMNQERNEGEYWLPASTVGQSKK
jgi:hypothetical protein